MEFVVGQIVNEPAKLAVLVPVQEPVQPVLPVQLEPLPRRMFEGVFQDSAQHLNKGLKFQLET